MPGLFNGLFGRSESEDIGSVERDEPKRQSPTKIPRFPRGIDPALKPLWAQVGHLSHDEFPFLHARYSPGSRVPCADFTGFIAQQVSIGDLSATESLLGTLLAANPGLGTDGEWIVDEINQIVSIEFGLYVSSRESSALNELTAMFMLASKDGGGREFWVTDEIPQIIASALSCYELAWTPETAKLRDKANKFIHEMRKDTPYWEEFPLYPEVDPEAWSQETTALGGRLQSLPPLTRAHLLNLAEKGQGSLLNDTTYSQRNLGLEPSNSAALILSSGICEPHIDANSLTSNWTKVDLCEIFDGRGIEYGKSWSKARLLELLNQTLPEVVEQASHEAMIVRVRDELREDLQAISARAEILQAPIELLCFATPTR